MAYDKKSVSHQLKIILGQVEGLSKMVEDQKYCVDVLIQSRSIQNSLKALDKRILEEHINSCVINNIKHGKEKQSVDELIKIYSLCSKG